MKPVTSRRAVQRAFGSVLLLLSAALPAGGELAAPRSQEAPVGRAEAVVDLATTAGVALLHGQWRYSDVRIDEVDGRAPGDDLKPSGTPLRTYDFEPKAGAADFDDSAWRVVAPESLRARRGGGRLCFNWYRIRVTIPERVGTFDTRGATVALEVVVDDYAEIWVDGRLPLVLGQLGGAVVRGFNAPNRVVLTRDAQPGQQFQIAIFGMNGPVSASPENFIWIKSATLDFHRRVQRDVQPLRVVRADPAIDAIVPSEPQVELLAGGFLFTEGPVWVRDPGYLLFSDPNSNVIYRWSPHDELAIYRTKSGYSGFDVGEYGQPGSNGLTLDREGRLTINQHGNRRVIRLESNGEETVLAEAFGGRRLNSPNDLVYRSDGALYFTDPPFGLPRAFDDPRRELPFSGIYRVRDGEVRLLSRELSGPNGLAFSPDEAFLYVGNWDETRKVVLRYPVLADGGLGPSEVFFDMTAAAGEDALDGLKVDQQGNVYVSGPGGLWILSAAGRHLGTLFPPEHPHNFAWGDDDGRTLYLTARTGLYRVRLKVPGVRP